MPPGATALLDDPVGQAFAARSVHDAGKFQFNAPSRDPVNQASAAPEHHRREGDCQLVEEARPGTAARSWAPVRAHILPLGSPPSLADRFQGTPGKGPEPPAPPEMSEARHRVITARKRAVWLSKSSGDIADILIHS